ncbi:hypothetical protein [Streptomyces chartreusis]|uniref:hypothetical protein n=1 Tax=Streptomyces chartreusis TaxID=1969 RepID=UPI00380FD046
MPETPQRIALEDGRVLAVRPWKELRESGLLWLINRTVFHPRGLALSVAYTDDGELLGWMLLGDGSEPIHFPLDDEAGLFAQAQATLAAACKGATDA